MSTPSSTTESKSSDDAGSMLLALNKLDYSVAPDLNLVQAKHTRIFYSSSQSYPLVSNQNIKVYLSAGSELIDAQQSHLSFDVKFQADVKVASNHARAPVQVINDSKIDGFKPYMLDPNEIQFFCNSGLGFFSRVELVTSSGSVLDTIQDPMVVHEINKRLGSPTGDPVVLKSEQKMKVGDHALLSSDDVSRELSGDDVWITPKLLKVYKPDGSEDTGAILVSKTKMVEDWLARGAINNNLSADVPGDTSEPFDARHMIKECFWNLDSTATFEFSRRFQIPLKDVCSFFDTTKLIPSQVASGLCLNLTLASVSDPLSVAYNQGRGSRSGHSVRESQRIVANGLALQIGDQSAYYTDTMGYSGARNECVARDELVRSVRVDSGDIDVKVSQPIISNLSVLATTVQMSSAILRKLDALAASGKMKLAWVSHTSKESDMAQDALLDGSVSVKPLIYSSQNVLRAVSFLQPNSVKETFNIHEQKAKTLPVGLLRQHEFQAGTMSFGREGSTVGSTGREHDLYPPIKEMLRSIKCGSKVSQMTIDQVLPPETRKWYNDGKTVNAYSGRKAQIPNSANYYMVCDLVRSTEKGTSGLPLNLSRTLQIRTTGNLSDTPFKTRTRDTSRKFPKAAREAWHGWSIQNTFVTDGVAVSDREYYTDTSVILRTVLSNVKYATILLNQTVVKE